MNDTIFHGGRDKLVQSRSGKEGGCTAKVCSYPPVCMQNTQDISAEMRILQETDPTLGVVRKAVDKKESASGVSFVIKDAWAYVPCGDDAVGRRF